MKSDFNFENASINRMDIFNFYFSKSEIGYLIYKNIQKLKMSRKAKWKI